MNGAIWAALAGIGFGFFQAFNRKAGRGMGDAYQGTFILLLVSALILIAASFFTEDVSLLLNASPGVYLNFGLAGFIHFFLGWTFISISQVRVGAARTGALIGATPLFATLVGIVFFDEILSPLVLIGIAVVIAGVFLISVDMVKDSKNNNLKPASWSDSIFGLGTAVCFAASAVFIRAGLAELASPLLGVTVGMVISTAAYGLVLFFRRDQAARGSILRATMIFQVLAGVFVGLATWMRWVALDMAPVGVVMSLGRLNVPVVLLVAPLLVGRQHEQVTARIWLGAILTIAGSLLLIFT